MASFHQTIDKVTKSVEETSTGISLQTFVLPVTTNDLKTVLNFHLYPPTP